MLKIRLQNSDKATLSYRNEITKIYRKEGIRGFTVGYSGMLLRDGPGYGMYFCLYDVLKRKFKENKSTS